MVNNLILNKSQKVNNLILNKSQKVNNLVSNKSQKLNKSVSNKHHNTINTYIYTDSLILLKMNSIYFTKKYLIEECKCNEKHFELLSNFFYNYDYKMSNIRGGEKFNPPLGWTAIALNVKDKFYDHPYEDNDWLASDGRDGEWAIAYHGFGRGFEKEEMKTILRSIIHNKLKIGVNQVFENSIDKRHPGRLVGKGVYVTPSIQIAEAYSGKIKFGNRFFHIVIMLRVKPNFIREPIDKEDYWVLDSKVNNIRLYKLLFKETD